MLLMIDNYDSFTFNVVQYLRSLGAAVTVVKNDELSLAQIVEVAPDHIVLSPGPGRPEDAGISMDVVRTFAGKTPILGVCLGHQVIGQVFGAKVVKAPRVMHGKASLLRHDQQGVFDGLPSPYRVTRYHSLVLDEQSLPECLDVTAWAVQESGDAHTSDANISTSEIMGVRHRQFCVEGVQFHPESVLTEHGKALFKNFLAMKEAERNT